jgi:1,4-alpha-glucan branching enzyme
MDSGRRRETATLLEGSWGEGGDHRAWLNPRTEWTWDRLYDAEADAVEMVARVRAREGAPSPLVARATRQALRECLLLEASDWQFLITTGSARDYAERRFATHYVELKRLGDVVRRHLAGNDVAEEDEAYVATIERRDRAFLDLDPAWLALPS